MTDQDIYLTASDLGVIIAQALVDLSNNPYRTRFDVVERVIKPIYDILKKQHEADIKKAISFINDNTRKFSDIEDVKVQFKKYMEE